MYHSTFADAGELCRLRAEAIAALERGGRTQAHTRAVTLVLSELATNALMHGLPPYSVIIELDDEETLVKVMDAGEGAAFARTPAHFDGGYGLNLVNTLAATWGAERGSNGKTVWAALDRGRAL